MLIKGISKIIKVDYSETPIVALDCEMVEIDRNSDGLAR